MVSILLASIHSVLYRMNTRKQNTCHALLISDYLIVSKLTHSSAPDIDLSLYCSVRTMKCGNLNSLTFRLAK